MLKIIMYGILFYLAYRLFIKPMLEPPKDPPYDDNNDRIANKGTRFGQKEGEFIDYEEID